MALSVLKDKGWYVSENALDIELDLAEESDRLKDPRRLEEFLLNIDLKEVGSTVLYEKFDRKKGELVGPLILQLTKWRNISYPSVGNHDKNDGVCTMSLSDGHGSVKTCSIEQLKIDGSTPYGSKVLLSGKIRSENGFLMLNNRNTTLLGGTVEALVEKWQTEKFSSNERKATNAPRWVPFSKAKNVDIRFDKNFNSLRQNVDSAEKEVDEKTAQFNAARQAQIEALDVPAPKPVKELSNHMKNVSLNEPQSSRRNYDQSAKQQFRNDQQPRQQNERNQRSDKFNQQDKGNFKNDRGQRGGPARGNDSRPRRNERQLDNQLPRNERQFDNRPPRQFDNRPTNQNDFQPNSGESFPTEFRRGGGNQRGRGNNRGQRGGRRMQSGQPGRQQNVYDANQQQSNTGSRLNFEMDFPAL